MLHLEDVTLRIAGRTLLDRASLHVPAGCRMALIGRNGTGKTTLLRAIAGEIVPDGGEIRLQRAARVGMIAQEAPGGDLTPLEAVLEADSERRMLLARAETAEDGATIAEIHTRLAEIGAEAAPARAARILAGLGFDPQMQARPLSSFSGGWRMRVALARVLFLEPDLLLLDEPTNHLDLEAVAWLEEHLRRYPRTLLLVSHDRDLLNRVPERICHLEGGKLAVYPGNYDRFARTRAERLLRQERERARLEAERRRIRAFIDRFRAKASKASQAQSRLKMLERLPELDPVVFEPEVHFAFPCRDLPAPPLLTLEEVSVGYHGRPVLSRLSLRIDPDDRIALLGRNGNGKSTFAKLVAGRLEPLSGIVTRARGLRVGFFAQHQIEDLDPEADAIRHLARLLPSLREEEVRARLARFGLSGQRAETPARSLSGGEKTRLCFALLSAHDPHILVLDEPTNHLDMDSREALVRALNDYPGAILLVSHDWHLVQLVCDRLWLVEGGRVQPFEGDLEAYRDRLLAADERPQTVAPARSPRPGLTPAQRRAALVPLRARAREVERQLLALQAEKAEIDAALARPSTYSDGARVAALRRRLAELETEIAAAEEAWLEAEGQIEALTVGESATVASPRD
ncbi:putative ABC transporter ATP-binding protein YheS [bacterium HR40]|nr:putative ABC transporter ATP-binding protein YheS [bacterium HR40]